MKTKGVAWARFPGWREHAIQDKSQCGWLAEGTWVGGAQARAESFGQYEVFGSLSRDGCGAPGEF